MSANKFDDELSSLYQQRKTQIKPPVFAAASITKSTTPQRSPWHILALLLTGGVASFGIMAVVTHFATPTVHEKRAQYNQHSVRVVELTEIVTPETVLLPVSAPLPPKPESLPPKSSANSNVSQAGLALVEAKVSVNKALSHVVKVPKIRRASIAITPTHRVMPQYPQSALYAQKSGTIKLQYRISTEGKVIDIIGLNSQGNRILERSAKQALAQWRYPATSGSDEFLEIEFEFNLMQ